jgi:hypothetical protein
MENKTTGNVQHSFNPQLASFMTRSSTNKNVNGKPSHHFLRFHFENTCCSIAALRFFCLLVAFFFVCFFMSVPSVKILSLLCSLRSSTSSYLSLSTDIIWHNVTWHFCWQRLHISKPVCKHLLGSYLKKIYFTS